ncbi:hypothetical protein QOZ80_5AG0397110 [Eleusine coracana subsp. coracana]|nr:hypothetical protein QOZ80_5AG0397110 [Eleusine coracana subsp. coracana]
MGKAGRWFRSFTATGGRNKARKDRSEKQHADAESQSMSQPSAREKRRWSFLRRPAAAAGAEKVDADGASQSRCFSEAEARVMVVQEEPDQRAAAAVTLPPPASSERRRRSGDGDDEEVAAAVKIQSAFRSYVARKALCALRGMVRLQAMVRGQLVRRQASVALRRMQALVDAQMRARNERLRLLDLLGDDDAATTAAPQHARRSQRKPSEAVARSEEDDESVTKIVEVDDGHGAATAFARRGGSCYSTPLSLPPAKAELLYQQKALPSELTNASRTLSCRLDDASESSSRRKGYMANTQSSRAKARRSQSAPRQRRIAASESSTAASPSPSCSCSGRRRSSLDPHDLLSARHGRAPDLLRPCGPVRVELVAGAAASVPGSECGSSAWRD